MMCQASSRGCVCCCKRAQDRFRLALPAILDNLRDKLKKRVEDVVASADPQRLEQEVVLLA